jgi:beta-xylosidase
VRLLRRPSPTGVRFVDAADQRRTVPTMSCLRSNRTRITSTQRRSHRASEAIVGVAISVVVALVSTIAIETTTAGAQSAPASPPSYAGDFPDPFILPLGGSYVAYSTQVGIPNEPEGTFIKVPVMTSTDLVSWTDPTEALPKLPNWAAPGNTWAPGVLVRSANPAAQRFVLYYTTTQRSSGRQCISVATASDTAGADGPFVDVSNGPLVCQRQQGGSIDPYPFVDANAVPYLLWKSDDNALGRRTSLWSQRLASNGLAFERRTSPNRLLSQTAAWQSPAMEGPAMVLSGATYFLFYGGGPWSSSSAAIGYGTCTSPTGPCTDRSTAAPWLSSAEDGQHPQGPHGPTIFFVGDETRMAFSGWKDGVGYPPADDDAVRAMWVGRLQFSGGVPTLV